LIDNYVDNSRPVHVKKVLDRKCVYNYNGRVVNLKKKKTTNEPPRP